jgi:hypothetical protein
LILLRKVGEAKEIFLERPRSREGIVGYEALEGLFEATRAEVIPSGFANVYAIICLL